jgi:CNT family concentrative nucleoside transporter
MLDTLQGLVGIVVILALCYALSAQRSKINWRTVGAGIALQVGLAFVLLTKLSLFGINDIFEPFKYVIRSASEFFVWVIGFADKGSQFIFGALANGGVLSQSFGPENGFVFAFMALTVIIFFGSLMALMYHLGVMQIIIKFMAKIMVKVLGISGAEAISVAANVFVGQTEAPLVIKPYIAKMTRSELFLLMVGGMATIAGGVMAAYIAILGGGDPEQQVLFASRFLTASIMAAPAAVVIAKLFHPETEESLTMGTVKLDVEKNASNAIEAAANGALEGLQLALNVAAMLLAFIALIALLNGITSTILTDWLGFTINGEAIDITLLLGYAFSLFGLIIGVPMQDIVAFGSMLGEKIIINEFMAYVSLGTNQAMLDPKTVFLATFAFCGFANLSSIAIQIGGIGSLAPNRKADIAKFGMKAVFGGTMATLLTASIAGIFF